MKKYQIEGTEETRGTERTYTHAVIVMQTLGSRKGQYKVIGYCGSLALAQKLAGTQQTRYYTDWHKTPAEIRPVIQIK